MLNEGLLKSLTLLHSLPLGMRQRLLWQRLKQCVWLTSDKRAETPQSLKDSRSVKENDLRFPRPGFRDSSLILVFCLQFAQSLNFPCNAQANFISELCDSIKMWSIVMDSEEPFANCSEFVDMETKIQALISISACKRVLFCSVFQQEYFLNVISLKPKLDKHQFHRWFLTSHLKLFLSLYRLSFGF